jgi:D-sedoheptulose 7-phosphate isomerase
MQDKIARALQDQALILAESIPSQEAALQAFAERLLEGFHQGGRLLVFGSGPLSPLAAMIAQQFHYRLALERPLLPALALGHDASLASVLARDGRSADYFARQLRVLAQPGDIVLALTDAPRDEAVAQGLELARELGCTTALLQQRRGENLQEQTDFHFRIETDAPARGLEGVLFVGQLLCELVEAELFGI